ncbi:MAG TPA: hypothetical protein PJ997_02970 [Candidatus Paceibacterota bacterium]|nr:hypothetical protein [Candidatus Paceibacterota bacterium]HMP19270.1 hypothetical protein [Candidatus Paceibacterota bacterium]HMP85559.1 hypothetical protein [Candidatus Paceibacterota bacterium]
MKIHKTLFILGLLILIMPFSGLPSNIEDILNVIFGSFLIIMAVSIKLKKVYKQHILEKEQNSHFVESIPDQNFVQDDQLINNEENNFVEQSEISNESKKTE